MDAEQAKVFRQEATRQLVAGGLARPFATAWIDHTRPELLAAMHAGQGGAR